MNMQTTQPPATSLGVPGVRTVNQAGQQVAESIVEPTVLGQIPVSKQVLRVKKAYFVTGLNTTVVMPNGDKVAFQLGIVPSVQKPAFVTDVEGYIQYLDAQIAARHPVIHTIEGYEVVTEGMLDPHDEIKKEAIRNYLASQEHRDMLKNLSGVGTPAPSFTSQSNKLGGIAGSDDLAATAAGSVGDAGLPGNPNTPATSLPTVNPVKVGAPGTQSNPTPDLSGLKK